MGTLVTETISSGISKCNVAKTVSSVVAFLSAFDSNTIPEDILELLGINNKGACNYPPQVALILLLIYRG
jgi:hypothetical protein